MGTALGLRLAQIFAAGGVDAVFGVPGGQTLPFYGATDAVGIRRVLMRDERNAACAADAYARIAGRVGVCDATVGPGVTNLVSGLAEAYSSSIPVVAVIADIRTERPHLRRRGVAAQAIDQSGMLASVTKWVGRVERPHILDAVVDHAIRVATTGRPGPVCIEIPEDVFADVVGSSVETRRFAPAQFAYPRYRPAPTADVVAEAAALLAGAERPLIMAGGGVTFSGAAPAVAALAEEHQIPVVTTISGKGTVDERSPLAAGVVGIFGTPKANAAMLAADVVLVIGSKLTQTATHNWAVPTASQAVIHVDIDGEEIGRTVPVTVGVCADARETAVQLREALSTRAPRRQNWLADLAVRIPPGRSGADAAVAPDRVAAAISDALGPEDILVCDASLASGWGAANFVVKRPGRTFVAPRGLAGIGWAAGAALGARMAAGEGQKVVVLAGDGGWSYALSEVETAVRHQADITYVILNNAALGWIKHIQDRMGISPSLYSDVDFGAVAQAMGAGGARVTNLESFEEQLRRGLREPGPYVIDVVSSVDASPIISLSTPHQGSYT